MNRRHGGFTLLEMLVVIVLTALIMGLLMQVFFFVLQFRGTFLNQVENQRTALLRGSWFRQVVRHIEPVPLASNGAFRGSTDDLEGFTLSPLSTEFGLSTPFSLQIERQSDRSVLRYREAAKLDWVLAEWNQAGMTFQYLDRAGRWVSQWPVKGDDEGFALPAAIMLTASEEEAGAGGLWLVRLRSDGDTGPEGG